VDWGWVVCRLWGWVVWSWLVFWVLGYTFVFNISDITSITIYGVGNDLGTTIRKGNTVFTSGSIAITVLVSGKVRFGVVISYGITVLVNSWPIISRFGMIRSWFVVSWCWVDNGFVYNGWGNIWSWLVDNWGNIWSWLVDNWGMIRSWFVDNWGMIRSWGWVVNWGNFVYEWSGVIDGGGMIWGSMMDSWVSISWGMYWNMGGGMYSSTILFSIIRVVYSLGSGMGLASNNGVVNTMRLVHRVAYSRGIAVFDSLVA